MHTILFYNVENLFDTINDPENPGDDEFTPEGEKEWTIERYQTKLNHIVEALCLVDGSAPAIVGFAEIENKQVLQDLVKTGELAQKNYHIIHYSSNDRRGIDCGIILDKAVFQVINETKHMLHISDEPDFTTRDILEITGRFENGAELTLFVNHWPSRREGTRETEARRIAAADLLRRQIDIHLKAKPKANIIAMGDFNDTPLDKSIREILRSKGQHEQQKGDLVNLLLQDQKEDLGTMVHKRDWDVFDQFHVSQGLMNELSDLAIFENEAHILKKDILLFTYDNGGQKPAASYGGDQYYGGYSDHLPIYLKLTLA